MTKTELQEENNYLMENLIKTTIEYLEIKMFINKLKDYYTMTPKNVKKTALHLGVSWNKRANQFESRIRINGKKLFLGYFETSSEAGSYYMVASLQKEKYENPKQFRELLTEILTVR